MQGIYDTVLEPTALCRAPLARAYRRARSAPCAETANRARARVPPEALSAQFTLRPAPRRNGAVMAHPRRRLPRLSRRHAHHRPPSPPCSRRRRRADGSQMLRRVAETTVVAAPPSRRRTGRPSGAVRCREWLRHIHPVASLSSPRRRPAMKCCAKCNPTETGSRTLSTQKGKSCRRTTN